MKVTDLIISDAEYWQERINLCERFFGESSGVHQKYLDEYQDNEEEILKGLKDLWKDYYDERKNDLKDLISYAEKLYDKEIDSLEASIDKLEERRDTEKKYWQAQIDDIDDEIDAIQDLNDEKQRALNLQEKQWNLQKAMHQRTILLYSESRGMYYDRDNKSVRDAKNDLDNTENDNKVADLKKQQKDLQKQLDIILESYDSQIESIEKQIDSLKNVKSAWSDIVENQEFKELEERLKSIFGDDVKDKILSGNTDFINGIVSQYSSTSDMLRTIEDATLADIQNMVAQYGILPENLMPITDAVAGITNTLGNVDTSGFNANLDNTAQSSLNATQKVQSVTKALNDLSNDVSNYQMPAVNADNFTASFAEDGAIITALKGFIERFKEICDDISDIWNTSLSKAFGAGGGNGDPLAGGLPNDTKYEKLFTPLLTAIDNCKLNMEGKLNECLGTFNTFQTDLSGVIGVESSGSSENSGTKGGSVKPSGGENKSGSDGSTDTIVGAIQEGGTLIDTALNGEEGWSASFNTAKDSIHDTATSIVECIESMASAVTSACISAIEAINMVANADENYGNNATPSPYIGIGHAHSDRTAHVEGTAKVSGDWSVQSDEKKALVGELGRELIVRNGKFFTVGDNGAEMTDIQKGDIVFNHEQTEELLKNGHISGYGKAYADGTVGGGKFLTPDGHILRPLQPGDHGWDLMQKFQPLVDKMLKGETDIISNAVFEGQRQFEKWTKEITNNTAINNITNNRNVQPVINQEIHVTLPNVTNSTAAEALLKDLQSLGTKKMQVNW